MYGKIFVFWTILFVVLAEKSRYDGFSVFRIVPKTSKETQLLKSIERSNPEYNFWTPVAVGHPVLIMVSPIHKDAFRSFTDSNGLQAALTITDVQALIHEEELRRAMARDVNDEFFWTTYRTLREFNKWLKSLKANKNFNVTRVKVGSTFEKRTIYGLKIMNSEGRNLPGVILESGIHPREWISPAVSSWIVNEILNEENKNSIWRKFNYLYIPIANPDGYKYTFNGDRLWRKTRKPFWGYSRTCYGVDLNRNWDYHWMEVGADNDPCSSTFAGHQPFSEIESKSLSEYFEENSKYDVYISFHSYAQQILFPYAHTGIRAPLHETWDRIGRAAARDLQAVHNTSYKVGSVYYLAYPVSGSSAEYYYSKYNATLIYDFELRDEGYYGFILPGDQIVPSAEETKAAVRRMLIEYQKL